MRKVELTDEEREILKKIREIEKETKKETWFNDLARRMAGSFSKATLRKRLTILVSKGQIKLKPMGNLLQISIIKRHRRTKNNVKVLDKKLKINSLDALFKKLKETNEEAEIITLLNAISAEAFAGATLKGLQLNYLGEKLKIDNPLIREKALRILLQEADQKKTFAKNKAKLLGTLEALLGTYTLDFIKANDKNPKADAVPIRQFLIWVLSVYEDPVVVQQLILDAKSISSPEGNFTAPQYYNVKYTNNVIRKNKTKLLEAETAFRREGNEPVAHFIADIVRGVT